MLDACSDEFVNQRCLKLRCWYLVNVGIPEEFSVMSPRLSQGEEDAKVSLYVQTVV